MNSVNNAGQNQPDDNETGADVFVETAAFQEQVLNQLQRIMPLVLLLVIIVIAILYWLVSPALAMVVSLLALILASVSSFINRSQPIAVVMKSGKGAGKGASHGEGPLSRLSGEKLADFLPDPLVLFDGNGTVLYRNHAAREAFPMLERDTSLYLCFRSPEMHSLIQAIIADGQARSIDYLERLPLERWYRASVMTFETAKGEADCFILIFRDQTELRRIDRMRADFIANASHELRTPLASLRGFIETLQGPAKEDPTARMRFLTIMQQQADRMSRLIDDLLSLSRLEMKSAIPLKEQVDIGQIINHVTETLAPMATDAGVVIEWIKPDHAILLPGDRDELIQVFQNLVENACKYGQAGERVVVSLEEQGNEGKSGRHNVRGLTVTIQDFGPGISPEHLPRLTERFYRVDVDSSRAHKGTGLGLAIVKHILTRHRGRLIIRSQLGKGSIFTVVFAIS